VVIFFITLFIVSVITIHAKTKHLRTARGTSIIDKQWSKWEKTKIDISWVVDKSVIYIFTEETQEYRLQTVKKSSLQDLDIYSFGAIDHNNVKTKITYTYSNKNGKHHLLIAYKDYAIIYEVVHVDDIGNKK
jgi:hypothetical protein